MRKARERPDDRKLDSMASHIAFEVDAMVDACIHASSSPFIEEACWLHSRAMIEFLIGREPKGGGAGRKHGDVWPTDFAPDWSIDAQISQRFWRHLQTLDQHLSHLSLARADEHQNDDTDLPHATEQMVGELVGLFARFARQANPAWNHWFIDRARFCGERLRAEGLFVPDEAFL